MNLAREEKQCCADPPCCPQFDDVELTDDEEEKPVPVAPVNVGVEQTEFELLKNVVFGLRTALGNLQESSIQNQEVIAKNMLTL